MRPHELLLFLPLGYLVTVLVETPVLLVGLSARHRLRRRLAAGLWLTACTYPVVVLVLPLVLAGWSRAAYLAVAETFAPAAECALFWAAFGERGEWGRRSMWRDFAAITAANLASFGAGELLSAVGWFGLTGGVL
ncbi:MAG TPA: hypothetical protein VM934_09350 [Pyrinomonadaceae bacterium]|jgi:hypothetical protein|nr:hypothetical protein [Pyrinomonadaceae bacterium]